MKRYKLIVAPYYRGKNKNFYAYKAEVRCYAELGDANPTTVWQTVTPRRREAKEQGERAHAAFMEREKLSSLSAEAVTALRLRREQPARRERFLAQGARLSAHSTYGMLGRHHSAETKAHVSQLIKQRHAEGVYRNSKLGRPTKEEAHAKATERARALGISVKLYLAQLEERKRVRAQRREEVLAARSLTPAQARAAVVKKILK